MSRATAWLSLDKIEGGGIITANITFLRRKRVKNKVYFWMHLYKGS